MSFTTGEIVSILAAIIAGGFVLWGEVIKRRTPSAEKEAEQEDQWRKELWEINRTLSADLAMTEKAHKETRKLLEQTEEACELLRRQNALLQNDKEAWLIEREGMNAEITLLKKDVFRLNTQVNELQRTVDAGGK
jgi:chromosome segregation ATPase